MTNYKSLYAAEITAKAEAVELTPFMESIDSLGLSRRVANAIYTVANQDDTTAYIIWDSPTPEQISAIRALVADGGEIEQGDLIWGHYDDGSWFTD